MPTGIGERLRRVRGGTSQTDFAQALGVATNTIGRYEREEHELDASFLLRLRKKRGVSADWLLSGEGSQYLLGTVGDDQASYGGDSFVSIPLYDKVTPRAGAGALVEPLAEKAVEMRSFSRQWIRHTLHANPADLVLMYVQGDSMDDGRDGLRPGDVAIVNKTEISATKDGVYVLRLDDALLVKRLQRLPGDRLRVISDNPAYQPFEVDLKGHSGGLQIIGRVVYAWGGRRF